MNTNITGFRWFSIIFASCTLDEISLDIVRVNVHVVMLNSYSGNLVCNYFSLDDDLPIKNDITKHLKDCF